MTPQTTMEEIQAMFQVSERKGDTIIGNDVWIGMEAVIMPGVKIGDGAIIGARSVVVKDVEPYTIVGGNPAKPLKKRFSDSTIETLQDIQWWNWPVEKVESNLETILSMDIEKLRDIA